MTADVELLPCGQCGMPCRAGEYHPFAACLMFKACHDSETVRANLAPLQAEIEALRAEVDRANGWNERVSVCRDHVADIVDGPCVICALDAAEARADKLRAEVEDYRTNGAAAVRFAPNSAHWSKELLRLFGDDARAGIEVLENWYRQELARAERLAEALRQIASQGPHYGPDGTRETWRHWAEIARAALEQESNDA